MFFNVEQLNQWFSEAYPEFADTDYDPTDEWLDDLWDDGCPIEDF